MKKLLFLFFLLIGPAQGWGATYYVSNTTSNGYTQGNDANSTAQAQSKSTPWLTLDGAEAKASNGDIVYVNTGTYNEDNSTYHCFYSSKAISWIADGGAVTVRPQSSTSYAGLIGGSTVASFNQFVFDATKVAGATNASYSIRFASTPSNKTFTNCSAINATTILIYSPVAISSIAWNGLTLTGSAAGLVGFQIDAANSSYTVTGLNVSSFTGSTLWNSAQTGETASIDGTGGSITAAIISNLFAFTSPASLTIQNVTATLSVNGGNAPNSFVSVAGAATGTITVSGNTVTYNNVASDDSIIKIAGGPYTTSITNNIITAQNASQGNSGISVVNQPSVTITGNIVDFQGTTSATAVPILVQATSVTVTSANISNNTVRTTQTAVQAILVGTDTTGAGDGKLDGATVSGNKVYGPYYYARDTTGITTHGIEFGWNKNASISKNYVNGCAYGIVVKASNAVGTYTSGGMLYNLLVDNAGSAEASNSFITIKGIVNIPVYNNTLVLNGGLTSPSSGMIRIGEGDTATENASGTLFKNNLVTTASATLNFICVGAPNCGADDGSTLTPGNVNKNLYWNGTSAVTSDFKIAGTTYSSWADWVAAGYDATSPTAANPLFVSATDFHLQAGSPAINAGVNVGLTTDYEGNTVPFGGLPDIGAYENQTGLTLGSGGSIGVGSGGSITLP